MDESRDRLTLAAFIGSVLMGGGNSIGIRLSIGDLPPFWGATIRFVVAGAILAVAVLLARRAMPRGRQLMGAVLFGLFNFGLAFVFIYTGLRQASASTSQVLLATVPLITLLLAAAQRVEPFRWRALAGSLVAGSGVALLFADRADFNVPLLSLLAILAGGTCISEAYVLAKRFPPGDSLPANAVGMLAGGLLLALFTVASGEPTPAPQHPVTWLALAYLIAFGSIGVFGLALFVLARWTATAISYTFLLLPLVTVTEAAFLLHEPIKPIFLVAGALVFGGVYLGAFSRRQSGARMATAEAGLREARQDALAGRQGADSA